MSRPLPLRAIAIVLCFPAVLSYASAQSVPHLRHTSAPFVGRTLTLEVDGGVPSSPVDLYFSPEAGAYPTIYGLLELRRNRLLLLAHGLTDAAGSWSFDLPVPLEEAWAETGAHFQALLDDPSAPGGRIFSSAVHARFLGPRVYAGYRGRNSPHRIGMYILSAVTDEVVARVDYGFTDVSVAYRHDGKPVFDSIYSRGAVMSTDKELVIFDPYFGAILGRVPFAATCSRVLFTDQSQRTVFVLETADGASPPRVHAFDLETGIEATPLDLPNPVDALWCGNPEGSEVFIAEHDQDGRTAIRWVGLDPLVDRGSARVGRAGEDFVGPDWQSPYCTPMAFASGQVFVSTGRSLSTDPYVEGSLTRCRPTPTGIGTRVSENYLSILTPAPQADRLLASAASYFVAGLWGMPLSSLGPPSWIDPPLGFQVLYVHELEVDQNVAWVLGNWEWQHADNLYRLDLDTHAWSSPLGSWPGRLDAEVVRDSWNHELWVAHPLPGFFPAGIHIFDELHGTTRPIPLEPIPEVLHAVPLP